MLMKFQSKLGYFHVM